MTAIAATKRADATEEGSAMTSNHEFDEEPPYNLYSLYEAVFKRHPRNKYAIDDDEMDELIDALLDICNVSGHDVIQKPRKNCNCLADLIEPQSITGDTSDGYHTFNELYDHRAKLFSVIVRCFKDRAWKSKLHYDGTMYEGMFIVGIETPQGQATYHYDIDPYWSVFNCKELDRAPEWDGHTPDQAISRIASLRPSYDRAALLALADDLDYAGSAVENVAYIDQTFHESARRIRKALGVSDEPTNR